MLSRQTYPWSFQNTHSTGSSTCSLHEKLSEVVDGLSGITEDIVRALKPHSGNQSPSRASVGSQSTTTRASVSPGKQVQLRGQLITQIKQLHELLEAGAISLEEYNSQKGTNFTVCRY